MRFPFRRNLADQDITRLDAGPDPDNPGLIKVTQSILTKVRDIIGDFFFPQLGVTSDTLKLLNVNRGVAILLNQFLGNQNRILEIVTVPGHKSDQHVLSQGQFAPLG